MSLVLKIATPDRFIFRAHVLNQFLGLNLLLTVLNMSDLE
ncbi:hypothetical protein P20652_0875 [Pseudoalteromonas sp. BSi20652]|nr:hypothetical protein P20652_0875 [Pseudoalteromonas sp. BSi20652]